MSRQLEPYQLIERSIQKKFHKVLWTPFITAIKQYELIAPGDRIAVCISGGKDSMLMAKLLQLRAVEHAHDGRLDHVAEVVAKGDLVAAELARLAVEIAAAHTRAEVAR